jgi:hypothetical protein
VTSHGNAPNSAILVDLRYERPSNLGGYESVRIAGPLRKKAGWLGSEFVFLQRHDQPIGARIPNWCQ